MIAKGNQILKGDSSNQMIGINIELENRFYKFIESKEKNSDLRMFIKEKIAIFEGQYKNLLDFFEGYIEMRKNNFETLKLLAYDITDDQIENKNKNGVQCQEEIVRAYIELIKSQLDGKQQLGYFLDGFIDNRKDYFKNGDDLKASELGKVLKRILGWLQEEDSTYPIGETMIKFI